MLSIYTDGATSNNGKENSSGGAGWLLVYEDEFGGEVIHPGHLYLGKSTNNICEMIAIIEAVKQLKSMFNIDEFKSTIPIYTDSAYIYNCYKERWYEQWKINGWRTASRQPVKNKELWEQLIPIFLDPMFELHKVKGHSTNKWNNYVDRLAVSASKRYSVSLPVGEKFDQGEDFIYG